MPAQAESTFDLELAIEGSTLFRLTPPAMLLTLRWERDTPKALRSIVLFNKLDGVGGNSLSGSHLRDDPRSYLSTTIVSHHND